jgi:hypothetical protein
MDFPVCFPKADHRLCPIQVFIITVCPGSQ